MGKTRNLNGEVVREEIRNVTRKRKMLHSFIRRISTEEEDDVFVNEGTVSKKMKKSSKRRTVLFIPGFLKNKKNDISESDATCDEMTHFRSTQSIEDLDFISKHTSVNARQYPGSSRTSISSLDTLSSVDSGIDCGQTSSTSSLSSVENLSFCDTMKGRDTVPRGRAPIASPEDVSLLESKTEDSSDLASMTFTHNNSTASFCTLSDNSSCSYDSCCSESSDSDSEDILQHPACRSESESESDSNSHSGSRRRQRFDSETDSDSEDDQCDSFFVPINPSKPPVNGVKKMKPDKKLKRSNSKLNLSLKKLVRSGSKLDLSLKKLMRTNSKSDVSIKKAAKKDSKLSVPELKSSPKRVLPKQPEPVKNNISGVLNNSRNSKSTHVLDSSVNSSKNTSARLSNNTSKDNSRLCDDFSRLCSDSESTSSSSRPRSDSDTSSSGSFRGRSIRCGITLGNSIKTIKLERSKSDCSSRRRPTYNHQLDTSQPLDNRRTHRQVLSNSPALQVRSRSFQGNDCDVDIDTCKSPMEVRQAMEKTAFWIENNDYDKTPDVSSTESLLQTSKDVTESELCNQIIGIYFGEENESDSSLSSSCLDNSMEVSVDENTPTVTSTPLETNLDDFSVATFVPAPYQTAQAKTRKISKAEPIPECRVKQAEVMKTKRQKEVLRVRDDNIQKPQSTRPAPDSDNPRQNRKPKMLSEEEIDTITKIHTICNGQRTVQYLNLSDIPVNFKHFPPPKRASKVVWNHELCSDEAVHHTPPPRKLPVQPRPILQQKPKDFTYPYKEDEPSPIVITKVRQSRSLPRKSREWPW